MSTLSLVFSLVSLAFAVVMALLLALMRRDEQQRSAARVAVLSGMAATDFLSESEPLSHAEAFAEEPQHTPAAEPRFAAPAVDSPWGSRLAIAGVIVAVLGVAGSIAVSRHSNAGAAPAAAPLELIALAHQQNGSVLSVSGKVRNPDGAGPVASPTATVFLFAADGSFLTSGRTLLETPTLTPGAESSFAVAIPVNGPVARYRVSFRDSANHPLAHLDRRGGAPLVRNQ
jgi:hypothetical protein